MNELTHLPPVDQEFWIDKNDNLGHQYIEPLGHQPDEDLEKVAEQDQTRYREKNGENIPRRVITPLHLDYIARIDRHSSAVEPDALVFTTTDERDRLYVHYLDGKLVVDINRHRYHLPNFSGTQTLVLRTRGGTDTIEIDSAVTNLVIIESGAGNDIVRTGHGPARIYAGPGDDDIFTLAGDTYVEAGDGDDHIHARDMGNLTAYGGKGNDQIIGGGGYNFIDGGDGRDVILGGHGHNMLSGGGDHDWITAGPGANTVYTGQGEDTVEELKPDDLVYATPDSHLLSAGENTAVNSHSIVISPDDPAFKGIRILGSEAFKERVNDDLKLLRSSGTGLNMLHALGNLSLSKGTCVFIKQLFEVNSGTFTPYQYPAGEQSPEPEPYIGNGAPGTGVPAGTVYYNPAFTGSESASIVHLYHQLCHAYNYLTGTVFAGHSLDGIDGDKPRALTSNAELQAVGLPVDAPAFDFDNDPATPALNSNPFALSENGLRHELGLPPRKQYNPS